MLGVNIPLGGKSRKTINSALDTQLKADILAFERSYASVCANLETESFTVANKSGNLGLLKNCGTDVVKRTSPITTPPVVNNAELDELKRQNAELRLMIAQLAEKLDSNKPVPGGY